MYSSSYLKLTVISIKLKGIKSFCFDSCSCWVYFFFLVRLLVERSLVSLLLSWVELLLKYLCRWFLCIHLNCVKSHFFCFVFSLTLILIDYNFKTMFLLYLRFCSCLDLFLVSL